jgi:hypothetical protein
MTTMIEVESQPRIDTLVRLAAGGEARRTDYVGTVWFDGKPFLSGLTIQRSPNAPRGIRMPNFQASGERAAIVDAAATFTDDPSGAPTWIQVHVNGHLGWPAGVGYRVVALTPPDAVR